MKILIIRTSALGDIVFASPLIQSIRRSVPDARITWLAEPAFAPLLEENPDIDEVLLFPKSRWKKFLKSGQFRSLLAEVRALKREFKKREFDLTLDIQGLLKSGLMAWISGAQKKIGLGSLEGSGFLMDRVISKPIDSPHISSEYYALIEAMGWESVPLSLNLMPETLQTVDEKLSMWGVRVPFCVIAPFTTRPQKHWVDSSWVETIKMVQSQLQMPCAILGGPGDQEVAEGIASASKALNLAGQTSIPEAAGIISRSALVLGVDTGLTHMGIACQRPTVAIFGSTCPYLETGIPEARVLYHKMDCSPCRRSPVCNGDFTCMKAVTPEEVLQAAQVVLHT